LHYYLVKSYIIIIIIIIIIINEIVLFFLAENGHISIIHRLLDAGCDLEEVNNMGNSALLKAVERKRFSTVKTLLESGANVQIK
jgi:ankyrin repeat protein